MNGVHKAFYTLDMRREKELRRPAYLRGALMRFLISERRVAMFCNTSVVVAVIESLMACMLTIYWLVKVHDCERWRV